MTMVNYGQVMKKMLLVHTLTFLDGVLVPSLFSVLLVPQFGMNGIYYA